VDWYDSNYYNTSPGVDPQGPDSGTERSVRGGGWSSHAKDARSASRGRLTPTSKHHDLGFRVVLPILSLTNQTDT